MRKLLVLLLVSGLGLFFPACKKDNPDKERPGQKSDKELFVDMLNFQDGALVVYKESLAAQKDSLVALLEMGKWLHKQEGVKKVKIVESNILTVLYENGISSSINIIPVASDGKHPIRQGGAGAQKGTISRYHFDGNGSIAMASKNIGSEKVLIVCPFLSEFYSGAYPYLDMFKDSKVPLDVTLVTDDKCTIDLLETFNQYGLIILNTHGSFTGAFYLYTGVAKFDLPEKPDASNKKWNLQSVEEWLQKAGGEMMQKMKAGIYEFGFSGLIKGDGELERIVNIGVTGLAVREMSNKLKDAVVFGNHCYSGQTDEGAEGLNEGTVVRSMPDSWKKAGASAYYGYAYSDGRTNSVGNKFCSDMEKRIITRLVQDGDSTGVAHLDAGLNEYFEVQDRRIKVVEEVAVTESTTAEEVKPKYVRGKVNMYCKLFDSPQYAYGCGEFTDPRDGQIYKLACIGDQTWFAENLRYAGGGVDYDNNSTKRAKYGRLYTRQEAMKGANSAKIPSGVQGICPEGWHVPSKAEWDKLITTAGGAQAAEKKLRSKTGWEQPNTDEYGFNMLPSGGYSDKFFNEGKSAYFWTTTYGGLGAYQGLNAYYPSLNFYEYIDDAVQTWKFSCRCVKDK